MVALVASPAHAEDGAAATPTTSDVVTPTPVEVNDSSSSDLPSQDAPSSDVTPLTQTTSAEPPKAPAAPVSTTTTTSAFAQRGALPADRPQSSEANKKDEDEHLRLGPLVGVGFPRPLAVEAFAKIERVVGVGVEYSFLPRMDLFGVNTSFKAVSADLRIFPFKGGFFIGARAGRQWLDAKTTISVGQGGTTIGSFTEAMDASAWFVNPRIGFLYTFNSGITVGIDAGVQLPIAATFERSGPATTAGVTSSNVDTTLRRVAGALGNDVTPTIDLLRLGFLF